VHCLIEATPGTTAFKWIRAYWHKRHGQVHLDKRELQNPTGYAIYCDRQAVRTIVVTTNWPQTQTPNLTGKFSKALPSISHAGHNSLCCGFNSNSNCPVPDYEDEKDTIVLNDGGGRPYDEPPYLDELPDDVIAMILGDEDYSCGDDNQTIAQPTNVEDVKRTTLVNNQNNNATIKKTVPVTAWRETIGKMSLAHFIRHGGVYNPWYPAAIYNIAPIITPPRAGPSRAAPDFITS